MINLLPPETKRSIHYARLNVALLQYCLLALAVCVALLSVLIAGRVFISRSERQLSQSIADDQRKALALAQSNREAKELAQTIDTIGNLLQREVKFTDLLKELGSVVPNGAVLTNLTVDSETIKKPVVLDFDVRNQRTAAVLRENLAASDLFASADILHISESQDASAYDYAASYQVTFEALVGGKP